MSLFGSLFSVGVLLVSLLLSALVGKYVILWIGGFRVAFLRVLSATIVAGVVSFAMGMLVSLLGEMTPEVNGLRLLAGWAILAVCHVYLSKSVAGERLAPIKAVFVAVLQAVGGAVALYLVLLLAAGVKKMLA